VASLLRLPKPFATGLALVIVGGGLFGLFRILARPDAPISQGAANGAYANLQGVTLNLRDGRLSTGDGSTAYKVESDKQGTYVALEYGLVEQPNGATEIGARRDTMKSYLDKREDPSRITFWVQPRAPADASPRMSVFQRRTEPDTEPTVR
jgi:hypothetical protein